MARRTTLTVDDIARAAAELQATGKNPTVAAVTAITGGSFTTVGRLLREWRGEAPAILPAARALPPAAGQDGSLPAPVAAALAHLGQAVAAAIGEARANMDALADDVDRLHDTVMGCGNTVTRQEYEAVVAERDALRQQLADRNDNTVTAAAPKARAVTVTDEEIRQAIADLTAKTGRVPSIKTIREALGGRPVSELRLRRAQAEAKKGDAAVQTSGAPVRPISNP